MAAMYALLFGLCIKLQSTAATFFSSSVHDNTLTCLILEIDSFTFLCIVWLLFLFFKHFSLTCYIASLFSRLHLHFDTMCSSDACFPFEFFKECCKVIHIMTVDNWVYSGTL